MAARSVFAMKSWELTADSRSDPKAECPWLLWWPGSRWPPSFQPSSLPLRGTGEKTGKAGTRKLGLKSGRSLMKQT